MQYFEDALGTINKNEDISFTRIKLNEELNNDHQQICDGLSNGISLLLDFTWSGNEDAQDLADNMSLPYLHVDVSIGPFLVLLDSYLDSRNSTDILIIFDKEECK